MTKTPRTGRCLRGTPPEERQARDARVLEAYGRLRSLRRTALELGLTHAGVAYVIRRMRVALLPPGHPARPQDTTDGGHHDEDQ